MAKPVIIINTICMAKLNRSKKPLYHDSIIFKGATLNQTRAINAVSMVKIIAKTKDK